MSAWIQGVRFRLEAWWFHMQAVDARIIRSCGHVEIGKVLPSWIARRRVTPCPECVFREALAHYKSGEYRP